MKSCDCVGQTQWLHEELVKYQFISDILISLAYFCIPIEIIYFMRKSALLPYKWVLLMFGAFIVLCGATHFVNLWTFWKHSKTVDVVLTVAKISCAVVSCATAMMLLHIIPHLQINVRELFLKNHAGELDRLSVKAGEFFLNKSEKLDKEMGI
ncbi:unnamed protein product [Dovyalis caffra]|uniref:Ethylene receptor 1-like N-terminal domain-containing protein n=1 Tax=Dovyalis caffra TaxID=77055 RepID=A0AAV1RIZ4_9ROSI|nr:unnamed protein product [Dovyalis caffra]